MLDRNLDMHGSASPIVHSSRAIFKNIFNGRAYILMEADVQAADGMKSVRREVKMLHCTQHWTCARVEVAFVDAEHRKGI